MPNRTAKLIFGAALTAISIFGADSLTGTWKYNVAKSTNTTSNPIVSRIDVYEDAGNGAVRFTRTEKRQSGASYNFTYLFKYDGKDYPVTEAVFNVAARKRIDQNTTTVELRDTRSKYHQTAKTVVSRDGKSQTTTTSGTDTDGSPLSATQIYDKQ
jgi:hypothetical protein